MIEPRQRLMETLGATGCYFLSIIRAAEKIMDRRIDAIDAFIFSKNKGWVGSDCFVYNPKLVLSYLTLMNWTMVKESPNYKLVPGEVVIYRYERATTLKTYGHFVLAGFDGAVEYDPLGDSQTVMNGKLVSMRVFRRIK